MACTQPECPGLMLAPRPRSHPAAGLCHGVCVDEELWDAYDRMGLSFQQHAADSAYNAHYDRPAMLAALGPVAGRQVLDAACGPGLYLRELLERGPRSPVGRSAAPEVPGQSSRLPAVSCRCWRCSPRAHRTTP